MLSYAFLSVAALLSPVFAGPVDTLSNISPRQAASGTSTFYPGTVNGGTCSFTSLPAGVFGTAFPGSSANCGTCLSVTGPNGNSITVMVVDQCSSCSTGGLDLFQDGFTRLGDVSAGAIATSYRAVPCPITSPLQLVNRAGTGNFFFSMQVVNHTRPVARLEVSTDGGATWRATTRSATNFFEIANGVGATTVTVRVTSNSGSSVVVNNVAVASGRSITAPGNL